MSHVDAATGLPVLVKQPSESREYDLDFTALLVPGETIAGITSVGSTIMGKVVGSADVSIGSSSITSDSLKVRVRISGGTNGEDYKITAVVTTNQGNTVEGEGILRVIDL